jgi:hypothetical protein
VGAGQSTGPVMVVAPAGRLADRRPIAATALSFSPPLGFITQAQIYG